MDRSRITSDPEKKIDPAPKPVALARVAHDMTSRLSALLLVLGGVVAFGSGCAAPERQEDRSSRSSAYAPPRCIGNVCDKAGNPNGSDRECRLDCDFPRAVEDTGEGDLPVANVRDEEEAPETGDEEGWDASDDEEEEWDAPAGEDAEEA